MPQSQYYEQEWDNYQHSSLSQWGYNSPESYYQQPYQQTTSYNPYMLAQKVTLSICLSFDDNKTHRSYLVLISCLEWVSGLH